MIMPAHIQKIYDSQVFDICDEYGKKCKILEKSYSVTGDKSAYIVGRDHAWNKFKAGYVKILLSLSWEDQIQFCRYAHLGEVLTQHLDNIQRSVLQILDDKTEKFT